MDRSVPEIAMKWLSSNPGLKELCTEFPDEWECVQGELARALAQGSARDVQSYLKRLSLQEKGSAKLQKNAKNADILIRHSVRYRMAHAAVKQHYTAVASGVESGKIRFNLLNGLVAQWLLFSDGLERKPASMFWFRLIWPLLWQKRLLMPLVQPEGIYCFYSRQLVTELAGLIGGRSCLEIAAGDGTLTRFLRNQGVQVRATDDGSWQHSVRYPEWVERLEAKEALRSHSPDIVICSWPPAGNGFERQVFRTKSVQLYIVIGSRHRFAAGNWDDYEEQTMFSMEEDDQLSGLVLPPELDAGVYLFRRKSAAA